MWPGREFVRRAHIDQDDIAPAKSLDQLLSPYLLDLVAEIAPRRSLDLGELGRGGVTEGEPDPKGRLTGDRIADPVSLALALDQAGAVEGLQMLGGVGDGLCR